MNNITLGIIVAIVLIAAVLIVLAIKQPKKVKEWLLYAVTLAEKDLGGGTGKIKLRKVYDMFVEKYPVVSFLVSFETFSKWVDVALDKMNEMLKENQALKAYVSDEEAELTDKEVESRILEEALNGY